MKVPLVEDNIGFDCCERKYRRCLLNTLIELKPKYCLEIGSFRYQSSSVFSYYFSRYMPGGKLITADIATWDRGEAPPNVWPVIVYPHDLDICSRHGGIKIAYENWKQKIGGGYNSIISNGSIIKDKMDELEIDKIHFCLIDADHAVCSFLSDIYITLPLIDSEGYILIDDVDDKNHELYDYYHNILKPKNNFYHFDGWTPNPGMALIKAINLNV